MSLRAVQEIEAVAAAGAAVLDALTNSAPPRVVLVEREVLDDYDATVHRLEVLVRRLQRAGY